MSDYINSIVSEISKITFDMFLDNEELKVDEYFNSKNIKIHPQIKIYDVSTILRTIDTNPSKIYRLFTPTNTRFFAVYVPKSTFMKSITETYKIDADILNQFTCDFYRQNIYFNNVKCSNIDELFFKLSKYNKMIDNSSTMMTILLMTCQSSHFLSYYYPHMAINSNPTNKQNTIYVMNGSKMSDICINMDSSEYTCKINSNYKILDIESNTQIYNIDAQTIVSSASNASYIEYKINAIQ